MTAKLVGMARRFVLDGLIEEQHVFDAAKAAAEKRTSLLHFLVRNKLLDQLRVAAAASSEFQLPLIDIAALDLSRCPEDIIDTQLIKIHHVLPLAIHDQSLTIAVSDPSDPSLIQELAFHSGLSINLVVAEDIKLALAIDHYLRNIVRKYSNKITAEESIELDSSTQVEDEEESNAFDETPLVRFINNLLDEAISLGASDVHFEPYETIYRVRFRIDGLLREMTCPPVKLTARLASRLKIMAHMDIAEKRVPQDGRMCIRFSENRSVDIRVNSLPTLWGEKIVLRILDPLNTNLDIRTLGMEPRQLQLYIEALQKHQGLILVTGPTGGGKSITLYSALDRLNANTKNISTVEDPIEIAVQGINQLAVNTKAGVTFASALRALLRQDPDIIMVGEIRDLETAEIAIRAAQTGHLVLTTLHTLSAAASLSRLRNMGIPLYNLASTISLVVAQRLARRLCENCKEVVEISEKVLKEQGFTTELHPSPTVFQARGCSDCRDGYRGRIGFFEVVPVSESLSRIIMDDCLSQRFQRHMESLNFPNLRAAALLKVAQGLTSLSEANRLT